ncbi:uncharacterized protein LOC121049044 isoform X1 [Rosa chinensis]|uniref:uncharacterized protein LOC121049044 isoform X1 n=1 Tax=Rosa chinensis TaxID=74649 RepID=UPI001AD8AE0C|nr:uncharacterized protein LOC121049044 isoform X1 [Rosa chinensis]
MGFLGLVFLVSTTTLCCPLEITACSQLQLLWWGMIGAVVYVVWHARNALRFQDTIITAVSIFRSVKVNTDGAAQGTPGLAGFGGIFCNHLGLYIGCFAGPMRLASDLEAELLTIYLVVSSAWRKGWFSLWIECDSALAIHFLSSPPPVYLGDWQLNGVTAMLFLKKCRCESPIFIGKVIKWPTSWTISELIVWVCTGGILATLMQWVLMGETSVVYQNIGLFNGC